MTPWFVAARWSDVLATAAGENRSDVGWVMLVGTSVVAAPTRRDGGLLSFSGEVVA